MPSALWLKSGSWIAEIRIHYAANRKADPNCKHHTISNILDISNILGKQGNGEFKAHADLAITAFPASRHRTAF